MATTTELVVKAKANTEALERAARTIAKHLTALADELALERFSDDGEVEREP